MSLPQTDPAGGNQDWKMGLRLLVITVLRVLRVLRLLHPLNEHGQDWPNNRPPLLSLSSEVHSEKY